MGQSPISTLSGAADMGNEVSGRAESQAQSPESYYTALALQCKGRLDNLEHYAKALVQSNESQSRLLMHLKEEEERRHSSHQTCEGLPQASAHGSSVDPDPSLPERHGNDKSKKSKKNKNQAPQYKDHQDSSDSFDHDGKATRTSTRAGRTFVNYSDETSGQAMDVDNPAWADEGSVDGRWRYVGPKMYQAGTPVPASGRGNQQVPIAGQNKQGNRGGPYPDHVDDRGRNAAMVGHGAKPGPSEDSKNLYLLESLQSNQLSTNHMSYGILDAVKHLQQLIPAEISSQHQSEISPGNYHVKLVESSPSRQANSILCRDFGSQTGLDKGMMERLLEQNKEIKLLKNDNESLERIRKKQEEDLAQLRHELEMVRAGPAGHQASHGIWPSRWGRQPPPPRQKATVQIYCSQKSEKIDAVSAELGTLLQTQFDVMNYDLTCLACKTRSQINSVAPVVVLCINASRIGTDVASGLEGLQRTDKIVVVVLHHKDTHALPRQPSHRLLTGPEYKSLGGIIDMAFLASRGVYTCDMNQRALDSLQNFILNGRIDL